MSDPEARLAAALDGCDDFDCEHRLVRHDPINGDIWWMRCRAVAAAILAADPTLAADLAADERERQRVLAAQAKAGLLNAAEYDTLADPEARLAAALRVVCHECNGTGIDNRMDPVTWTPISRECQHSEALRAVTAADPTLAADLALAAAVRADEPVIYGAIWNHLGEQRRSLYLMRDIEMMVLGVVFYRAAIEEALSDD